MKELRYCRQRVGRVYPPQTPPQAEELGVRCLVVAREGEGIGVGVRNVGVPTAQKARPSRTLQISPLVPSSILQIPL